MINWDELSDGEVAALARALYEARFADEPYDPLVWQSPIVIDMHVAAIAEQERRSASRRRTGAVDREAWFQWRNRPEHAVVVRRLAQDPRLARLCREDGGQTLRNLLRPFILDDADVATLLEQVGRADPA